jgi:hypothetical protein
MTSEPPSRRVVDQRVRNRVIEWLELASSFSDQRQVAQFSPVSVPNEMINSWEDHIDGDPRVDPDTGAYSAAELVELGFVFDAWNAAADELPKGWPTIEVAQSLTTWNGLRLAASRALGTFAVRGRMSEETEEAN